MVYEIVVPMNDVVAYALSSYIHRIFSELRCGICGRGWYVFDTDTEELRQKLAFYMADRICGTDPDWRDGSSDFSGRAWPITYKKVIADLCLMFVNEWKFNGNDLGKATRAVKQKILSLLNNC